MPALPGSQLGGDESHIDKQKKPRKPQRCDVMHPWMTCSALYDLFCSFGLDDKMDMSFELWGRATNQRDISGGQSGQPKARHAVGLPEA